MLELFHPFIHLYQNICFLHPGFIFSLNDLIRLDSFFFSYTDAVHAALQQARQAASAEMVRPTVRQREEEDHAGAGTDRLGTETQDVQLSGVARPQDCLQKVSQY